MAIDRVSQGEGGKGTEEAITDWVLALTRKRGQNSVCCTRKPRSMTRRLPERRGTLCVEMRKEIEDAFFGGQATGVSSACDDLKNTDLHSIRLDAECLVASYLRRKCNLALVRQKRNYRREFKNCFSKCVCTLLFEILKKMINYGPNANRILIPRPFPSSPFPWLSEPRLSRMTNQVIRSGPYTRPNLHRTHDKPTKCSVTNHPTPP